VLHIDVSTIHNIESVARLAPVAAEHGAVMAVGLPGAIALPALDNIALPAGTIVLRRFGSGSSKDLQTWLELARQRQWNLAAEISPDDFAQFAPTISALGGAHLILTLTPDPSSTAHPTGQYRQLADCLRAIGSRAPLWIRCGTATGSSSALERLLGASVLAGSLLCDGLGDLVGVDGEESVAENMRLAYNVLQGAGARITKTEYVACPSCGRTLFDLQTTTRRVREATGHLKGVKIAVMGCIVNGPGEMADADFGYVGGAPGKINLYVGRNAVRFNIPEHEAVDRLLDLIREHGRWVDRPAPADR
jgi:(E)-4-hydroxy-3-methylbut-2-enyl-diphosphate synthase